MQVSDFVIKETVTNSGVRFYQIGVMKNKRPKTLFQLLRIKPVQKEFILVDDELCFRYHYSFIPNRPFKNTTFGSFTEAERYLIKKIQEKHDRQIKSERIIELE